MENEERMARFKAYAAVLATGLFLAFVTLPFAGIAQPEPKAPVIYLADNLDEAEALGWCIDTLGRGFAETLQAHSCKPQGGDTQFLYDVETMQIRSVPFADKCMAFADPTNASVPFTLIDCDATDLDQQFQFDAESGLITLNTAPDQCVTVGAQSRTAGPFMSRDLTVTACADADPALATWIYKPSSQAGNQEGDDQMLRLILMAGVCSAGLTPAAQAQDTMSFFITSENPGEGANLGGLAGADAHCAALAEAAGVTGQTWAAYLSSSTENARDRIGTGPWVNANGVVIANSVDELQDAAANNLNKETALSEFGVVINGRGDDPNRHDILTGSNADGVLEGDACMDWTSTAGDGSAMVGHHDRTGGGDNPTSWIAAHPSRGCGLEDLRGTGGDGLFYCFATN